MPYRILIGTISNPAAFWALFCGLRYPVRWTRRNKTAVPRNHLYPSGFPPCSVYIYG